MVRSKLLNNSPIKVEDVTNRPYLAGVQGKIVRHKVDRVEMDSMQIPRYLYDIHIFNFKCRCDVC